MNRETPPNKLSVEMAKDDDDAVYWLSRVRIFLDGVQANEVIEYDTEAGYIERYVLDDNNRPVVEREHFKTERVEGVVTVQRIPD